MYYKRSAGIILVRKSIDAPSWVKWVHHSEGKTHCPECLKLDGCFFTEVEHPPCPHHPYCHCTLEAIDYAIVLANVTVDSKYSKFDVYLFNTLGEYNNYKADLFRMWGYDVEDIPWMKAEWERQAYEKYLAGDYKLNLLDEWGSESISGLKFPVKIQVRSCLLCQVGWYTLTEDYSLQHHIGDDNMQEMDCIEVTVEKEKYARHGVHKGMQGWICDPRCIGEAWLVNFPQCGENDDIATIGIKETDMKAIPKMYAKVNERIKARFEDAGNSTKELLEKPEDLSGYLI